MGAKPGDFRWVSSGKCGWSEREFHSILWSQTDGVSVLSPFFCILCEHVMILCDLVLVPLKHVYIAAGGSTVQVLA
jgi:hypothetical protein